MRLHLLPTLLLCCAGTAISFAEEASSTDTTVAASTRVELSLGPVNGVIKESTAGNVLTWFGLPYARPPVGDLRWLATRAPQHWLSTLEGNKPSSPCLQFNSPSLEQGPGDTLIGSEDCLYLNIWAPERRSKDGLPVMVWVHGGSNVWGHGAQIDWSEFVAREGVVVVSPNYRLGPLGWFAHSSLRDSAEGEDRSANFGLLDLIQALRWTQSHISAFGGDSTKVTLFGQSAGAFNIAALLAAPQSQDLFHGAILQSGGWSSHTLAEAERGPVNGGPRRGVASREVIHFLRENQLLTDGENDTSEMASQLRQLDGETLFSAYRALQTEPALVGLIDPVDITADGIVVPISGLQSALHRPGGLHPVPIMSGTNRDEVRAGALAQGNWVVNLAKWYFSAGERERYLERSAYANALWHFNAVQEPFKLLSGFTGQSLYAYRFDWRGQGRFWSVNVGELVGAAHSLELPFISGDFEGGSANPMGMFFNSRNRADRLALSHTMMAYWAEFARSVGDSVHVTTALAGPAGLWEPWREDGPNTMLFDSPSATGTEMHAITPQPPAPPEGLSQAHVATEQDYCAALALASDVDISTRGQLLTQDRPLIRSCK